MNNKKNLSSCAEKAEVNKPNTQVNSQTNNHNQNSAQLFAESKNFIPGGVNSPVRAFSGVDNDPLFITRADGAYMYDADGQAYIDFVGSWGPMILGHNDQDVAKAVKEAIANGLSFGAPTAIELDMAQFLCQNIRNLDMVRMVSSGTEATMSAIRLARGYTQRNKIIKFLGCYHGHSDALLVKAGSGGLTFGVPSSAGVTPGTVADTLVANFNDLSSVEELFRQHPDDIACIIVEPVAGNMNCVPPQTNFLPGLRTLCDKYGALLIFDEVMTGFRVAFGGSQEVFNVDADLITMGKIIGGGMPVGAFGGKKEIMHSLAPLGPVYQAGTLSGNPLAMTAGLTTLKKLKSLNADKILQEKTANFLAALKEEAKKHKVPFTTTQVGAMFGIFFSDKEEITSFSDVEAADLTLFKKFHSAMLAKGCYFAPSAFEASFMSLAHSEEDLAKVVTCAGEVFSTFNK